MDNSLLIELAENEVSSSDYYDSNPEVQGFTSLFSGFTKSRINDLESAIAYYKSLTEEQIERRYSIHYWEECAIGAYASLRSDFLDYFGRSIDKRELARREAKNVELLLREGKYQILPDPEYMLVNEMPAMYEKLVTGKWTEFFNADELEAFQTAHQENQERMVQHIFERYMHLPNEDDRVLALKNWLENGEVTGPKYIDYFNKEWVLAMQIQALVWYKIFLEKTSETGELYYVNRTQEIRSNSRAKTISMASLRRTNDGYEAIKLSFADFLTKHHRKPSWSELMAHMIDNPPDGFLITGKRRGAKVESLIIEGVDRPIDRAAFKKRYERYFLKSDNKQDNK
jgi:hypothetical protein